MPQYTASKRFARAEQVIDENRTERGRLIARAKAGDKKAAEILKKAPFHVRYVATEEELKLINGGT